MRQKQHLKLKAPRRTNAQLSRRGFSVRAEQALNQKVQLFKLDLIEQSANVAKHNRSDVISIGHIEQACDHLVFRKQSRRYRHLGYVAGIVVGAGLSATLGFANSDMFRSTCI
jgi:hypothetical protein